MANKPVMLNGKVFLQRKHSDSKLEVDFKFPSNEDFNEYVFDMVKMFYPGWKQIRATHSVMLEDDEEEQFPLQ